ncbi:hypothetical protein B6V72_06300 [Thioclava sp. F34-6]|nr:hypothetical protein B6V72_06300 [Thioclava sp. F34-6]
MDHPDRPANPRAGRRLDTTGLQAFLSAILRAHASLRSDIERGGCERFMKYIQFPIVIVKQKDHGGVGVDDNIWRDRASVQFSHRATSAFSIGKRVVFGRQKKMRRAGGAHQIGEEDRLGASPKNDEARLREEGDTQINRLVGRLVLGRETQATRRAQP